ncbi:hypothetical protein DL765_005027 [Monosporascus sp. GIB2]|nr:hypothetical protein DL765_005027 [Monosporascus sp. GIB2]
MAGDEAGFIMAEDFMALNPALFPEPDYVASVARVLNPPPSISTIEPRSLLSTDRRWSHETDSTDPKGVIMPARTTERDILGKQLPRNLYHQSKPSECDGPALLLPPDEALATVTAMMHEYFAAFDSWSSIPISVLMRNLYESLYVEARMPLRFMLPCRPPYACSAGRLRAYATPYLPPALPGRQDVEDGPGAMRACRGHGRGGYQGRGLCDQDLALFAGDQTLVEEEAVDY